MCLVWSCLFGFLCINIMLTTSYVPEGFRKGRVILTYKDSDVNTILNWRPISIYTHLTITEGKRSVQKFAWPNYEPSHQQHRRNFIRERNLKTNPNQMLYTARSSIIADIIQRSDRLSIRRDMWLPTCGFEWLQTLGTTRCVMLVWLRRGPSSNITIERISNPYDRPLPNAVR